MKFQTMWYHPYNLKLKDFSRQLRNNSTHGEIVLWKRLRAGSVMGYTFNRQKPLDNYVVDFYCKSLNLVIEIDGGYHLKQEQRIKDAERQTILEDLKLKFLRFTDEETCLNTDRVVEKIREYIINFEEQNRDMNKPKHRDKHVFGRKE